MGILCVFCVYDTIGNRCFEKTSFPKIVYIFDLDLRIQANDGECGLVTLRWANGGWDKLSISSLFSFFFLFYFLLFILTVKNCQVDSLVQQHR